MNSFLRPKRSVNWPNSSAPKHAPATYSDAASPATSADEMSIPEPLAEIAPAIEPTIVTSSPSRIQTVPRPIRIFQCQCDQGSRSSRAGMSVSIVPRVSVLTRRCAHRFDGLPGRPARNQRRIGRRSRRPRILGAAMAMQANTEDPRIVAGMAAQGRLRESRLAAGERRVGWKAGLGTAQAMEKASIAAPLTGFLTNASLASGMTRTDGLSIDDWRNAKLEPEVAVRIGSRRGRRRRPRDGRGRDLRRSAVDRDRRPGRPERHRAGARREPLPSRVPVRPVH